MFIIMNYHFEINKNTYSDMWSYPVHSLNCVLRKMGRNTNTCNLRWFAWLWILMLSSYGMWHVWRQIQVVGRNLLPVCSFLHPISLKDGDCRSYWSTGSNPSHHVAWHSRRLYLYQQEVLTNTCLFNKWMAVFSNTIVETNMISKYDSFIHEIRGDSCSVLLQCAQYCAEIWY
jgi:hypothetical protein